MIPLDWGRMAARVCLAALAGGWGSGFMGRRSAKGRSVEEVLSSALSLALRTTGICHSRTRVPRP